MTDSTATAPVDKSSGAAAMSRLADRLVALAPPPAILDLTLPRQSPAVTAALARSSAAAARAARRARSRSVIGVLVDSFVSACSFIPYALIGLGLRLIVARIFFLDGQTKIDGPIVPVKIPFDLPINLQGFDFSVMLPMQIKADTFTAFLTKYSAVPLPPLFGAYLVSYAEFILPIFLLLGFATRFSALGLLIITAMIQVYVMPEALWTVHIYWAAMLAVLISLGPGQISVDHIIRFIARR
ncbi:MAG TPA: DoxX family protein [Pseudolabrys sp.]|jgi:putative oxidoreductase|nr:DoxX family protein [Pseudolabrys sp.]